MAPSIVHCRTQSRIPVCLFFVHHSSFFLCDAYFFLKQSSIGFRLKVHDFSVCGRLVTEREKQLLASKQYTNLIHEQKRIDAEIDKKVRVLILDTNQTTHVRSF